jgi:TonB family protein
MPKREKFGKFVLLEETDRSGLGTEFRAAKLGPSGFEKIVSVLRLSSAVSANAEAARSLMDQVKVAAQLQNPNVIKIFGIGKVEAAYYVSYEFLEGRSLKAILERCRQETFPFSVDHGLLIASKVCSALEYSHARRLEGRSRYFHGLLNPSNVLVSYEGEVRVRGFGYWPSRAREVGAVGEEESRYLSPEQSLGGNGDPRSDIFSVGAILFEILVGQPVFQGGRTDIAARLAQARLQNPTGEDDSVPKPIAEILSRSLTEDPAARYPEVQEMRKAIDTLLFSGDFTPTTFNLAFFMHSLFRDDIEDDSKRLKEEREASYFELSGEEPAAPPAAPTTRVAPPPARPGPPLRETVDFDSVRGRIDSPRVQAAPTLPPSAPLEARAGDADRPVRDLGEEPVPEPSMRDLPIREPLHREVARDAAAGFTFHKDEPKGRSVLPLVLGLALAVAVGLAYWFLLGPGRRAGAAAPPPVQSPPSPSAEQVAALARVKELEEKLAAMEAEKAAIEAKAGDDARKKVEAQAAARGQVADPVALQRAQDEARRKAQADQERKQQEERRRLEDAKRNEELRLADERRRREEDARTVATAEPPPTTVAATLPPATTFAATTVPATTLTAAAPSLRAGTLVNIGDPGVVAPVPDRAPPLQYPPIALRQRVEGTVELNVLIDEKGGVLDAQVVAGAGGKIGLNEAAIENVKRRRYRPATKEGIPVKVWIPVRVRFTLPK